MEIQKLDGTCSTVQLWRVGKEELTYMSKEEFKEKIKHAFYKEALYQLRNLIYFTNFTSISDRFLLWRLGFKKIGSYYNDRTGVKVNIMFYSVKNFE